MDWTRLTDRQDKALRWLAKREWRWAWRFMEKVRRLPYCEQRDILFLYEVRIHWFWGWQAGINADGVKALCSNEGSE